MQNLCRSLATGRSGGNLSLSFLITVLFENTRKWKRIIFEYLFAKVGVLVTLSFKDC